MDAGARQEQDAGRGAVSSNTVPKQRAYCMNHANQREILEGVGIAIIIEPVGIQVHPAELEFHTYVYKQGLGFPTLG
jgi:hypothetical protein